MKRFDKDFASVGQRVDIAELVELDEIGDDRFRSRHNQPNVYRALFGGQIVAQALAAADLTVADRAIHSLHAYFLRAGRHDDPIDFRVERVRDGGRFSTRRVEAVQAGDTLFTMDCSYRVPLEGFSHQRRPGIVFDPEAALGDDDFIAAAPPAMRATMAAFQRHYPVEIRIPSRVGFFEAAPEPKRHFYLRAPGSDRIDDPTVHRQIFAFLSDFMFAGVPLVPHTVAMPGPHVFVASLDHAIWFHRPIRCDDWLLFETESPSAEGGINLARGLVYDRSGRLVATIAQEALQQATPDRPL